MDDFQARLQNAIAADFLIEKELGGGGMSRVFLATERALQRRVVIKVLPPDLAAGVNIERFRREIQLAAALQHPHIVPLLMAGDSAGLLWYSMPFIEGESLRSALASHGRHSPRDVVRILHDVVDALAYAHSRGVIHRDIKPDNILVSGMHALVTDFGVAKALSAAIPSHGGTTTGMAIGTPAYMAPEQLAADPAADHRIDLYAVGLLAYELLTGHSPFTSTSPQATLAAQLTKVPEPPHRSYADIPESLSAIIMHCLEKDASKRPATAAALLADLDALPPMGSGRSASRRMPRRRARLMMAGGAALVALALLAASRDRIAARFQSPARPAADTMTARDAGPGGSRTPAMQVADAAKKTSPTRPETVIVIYRDTANYDGARGVSVPLVISRAESLAIADAMRKRQGGASAIESPSVAAAPVASATAPAAATAGGGSGTGSGQSMISPVGAATVMGQGASGTGGQSAGGQSAGGRVPGAGAALEAAARANSRVMLSTPGVQVQVGMERDEMFREVKRVFTDSMTMAFRNMDSALKDLPRYVRMELPKPGAVAVVPLVAPNNDGRTRVVVGNFANATGNPEMTAFTRNLSTTLRSTFPSDRFEVVSPEVMEKASKGSPDRMAMGWMLRSDYVVSGLLRMKNDSLQLVTILTDVRGGHYSRHLETTVPMSEPNRAMETTLSHVKDWLDSARVREARGEHGPKPKRPVVPRRGER